MQQKASRLGVTLNGWWRIAIVIMALILSFSVLAALNDDTYVGKASILYNAPTNENVPQSNQIDKLLAAFTPCPKCDAYATEHNIKTRSLAVQIATSHKCFSWTTRFEQLDDGNLDVWCKTPRSVFHTILNGVIACLIIAVFGLALGWIAAGFKSRGTA